MSAHAGQDQEPSLLVAGGIKPVVVVPTYNHGSTLMDVLEGIVSHGLAVIVVDDGSTDSTPSRLAAWRAERSGAAAVIHTHKENRGKAGALRTGFGLARKLGYTHAATIDADGQLDPADLPRLIEVAATNPRALVLGERPIEMERCPSRCLVGRRFAGLGVLAQCGRRLADTQCGLRVYPLDVVEAAACRASRFSYETEIIVRAAWAGFDIVGTPIRCVYFDANRRVSHFRPWRDSLRQAGMHIRLLGRALVPVPLGVRGRGGEDSQNSIAGRFARWIRWISPARCVREARGDLLGFMAFCTAVGFGIWAGLWLGLLPVPFLWAAGAVYFAWRWHLHPLASICAACAPAELAKSALGAPPLGLGWPMWLIIGAPLGLFVGVCGFWIALGLGVWIGGQRLRR